MDSDRILVLDDGHIAEFDSPSKLLQKENGHFRSMVEKSKERALRASSRASVTTVEKWVTFLATVRSPLATRPVTTVERRVTLPGSAPNLENKQT